MFQLVTCKMASSHSIRQGGKTMESEVLNRKSQQAMRAYFIFLFGRTLQIHFIVFKDCTYCSELIMAPLFKNSANKIPLLSHKALTITQYTVFCTFHLFYLQSQFSTTQLSFWLPERCTPRMQFCSLQPLHTNCEIQLRGTTWRSDALPG